MFEQIQGKYRLVTVDDQNAEVSVVNNAVDTTILSFRTAPGLRGWLTFVGVAWDAGMNRFVDFTVKVNGSVPLNYGSILNKSKIQCAAPEQDDKELPISIPVPQSSLVELIANQAVAGVTGNFTGRIIVKYTDPLEDKRP